MTDKHTEKHTETHACDSISRQAAIDAVGNMLRRKFGVGGDLAEITLAGLPSAQPDITDEQAIGHLQASGWMQSHDKQMYEMGQKERLADDSDSYDALLPSAQPTEASIQKMQDLEQAEIQKAYELGKLDAMEEMPHWISCSERLPEHGGRYLISALDGINRRTTVAPYLPRCKSWTMTGRMAYWRVIAWMPLPEPYKER